jgi:hypothetical protein
MAPYAHAQFDDKLLCRVVGEFLEMPGLKLTSKQAKRLWGLEEPTCKAILEFLVEADFLWQPGRDTYTRLTEGPARFAPVLPTDALGPLDGAASVAVKEIK